MMRHGEDERVETPPRSGATDPPEGDGGRIPAPSPEEVPELLGERSDYPIPFGDESRGGEESPREDGGDERPASRKGSPGSRQ
jgi:hypothetical protein